MSLGVSLGHKLGVARLFHNEINHVIKYLTLHIVLLSYALYSQRSTSTAKYIEYLKSKVILFREATE